MRVGGQVSSAPEHGTVGGTTPPTDPRPSRPTLVANWKRGRGRGPGGVLQAGLLRSLLNTGRFTIMTVCRNPYILFPLLEKKCLNRTSFHAKETEERRRRERKEEPASVVSKSPPAPSRRKSSRP